MAQTTVLEIVITWKLAARPIRSEDEFLTLLPSLRRDGVPPQHDERFVFLPDGTWRHVHDIRDRLHPPGRPVVPYRLWGRYQFCKLRLCTAWRFLGLNLQLSGRFAARLLRLDEPRAGVTLAA